MNGSEQQDSLPPGPYSYETCLKERSDETFGGKKRVGETKEGKELKTASNRPVDIDLRLAEIEND